MWLVLLTVDSRHVVACLCMLGLWLAMTMPSLIHTPQGGLVKYLCTFFVSFFFLTPNYHTQLQSIQYMLQMHVFPLWAVCGRMTRFSNHKKMSLHQHSVIFLSLFGVKISMPSFSSTVLFYDQHAVAALCWVIVAHRELLIPIKLWLVWNLLNVVKSLQWSDLLTH